MMSRYKGQPIPAKVVERLSLYHRILSDMKSRGTGRFFSHELAALAHETPATVRRDLMATGSEGSPSKGYSVSSTDRAIGHILHGFRTHQVALVGIGKLGRSLLDHFEGCRAALEIGFAFDVQPAKLGLLPNGTQVLSMDLLEHTLEAHCIRVAILATPASAAQEVADRLVKAGVRGILNFTHGLLIVPDHVFVEEIDLVAALEKVAHFGLREEIFEGV
jgi:redox-sensing transcriptional repressor